MVRIPDSHSGGPGSIPGCGTFFTQNHHINILQQLQINFLSTLFSQYFSISPVKHLELSFVEIPLAAAAFNHFIEWAVVLFLVFHEYFAEIYFLNAVVLPNNLLFRQVLVILFGGQFQHGGVEFLFLSPCEGISAFLVQFGLPLLIKFIELGEFLVVEKLSLVELSSGRLANSKFVVMLPVENALDGFKLLFPADGMWMAHFVCFLDVAFAFLSLFEDEGVAEELDAGYFSSQLVFHKLAGVVNITVVAVLPSHLFLALFFRLVQNFSALFKLALVAVFVPEGFFEVANEEFLDSLDSLFFEDVLPNHFVDSSGDGGSIVKGSVSLLEPASFALLGLGHALVGVFAITLVGRKGVLIHFQNLLVGLIVFDPDILDDLLDDRFFPLFGAVALFLLVFIDTGEEELVVGVGYKLVDYLLDLGMDCVVQFIHL